MAVHLVYNGAWVSGIQQSDSVIYIHVSPFFYTFFFILAFFFLIIEKDIVVMTLA